MHQIVQTLGDSGFGTAIDDFGAGYAGLNLLANFHPNIVKLDMGLIRGIDSDHRCQAIIAGIMKVCGRLALEVIAEGIETAAYHAWLRGQGIRLFQGFFFARPQTEALPQVSFTDPFVKTRARPLPVQD